MPASARHLPDLDEVTLVTDGGLETDLIFNRGFDLPHFAAFTLLDSAEGREALRAYFAEYVAIARRHGTGLLLETPTWRAAPDWGPHLDRTPAELDDVNRRAVALVQELRDAGPDVLLLVLSEKSMSSEWVMTEIRKARKTELREKRQKLFPIRLCSIKKIQDWTCFDFDTGKDLAVEVREYHIPDFSNWKDHDAFESAFADLLRDLKAQA